MINIVKVIFIYKIIEIIKMLFLFQIVNDLFAFLNAEVIEFELLYDILEFLTEETNYSVWISAIDGFKALRTKFMCDPKSVIKIDVSAKIISFNK